MTALPEPWLIDPTSERLLSDLVECAREAIAGRGRRCGRRGPGHSLGGGMEFVLHCHLGNDRFDVAVSSKFYFSYLHVVGRNRKK